MSFPNIPNVTPTINVNREQVVNLLLASIAFEELGLAHIINAEAEKLQAVIGSFHKHDHHPCEDSWDESWKDPCHDPCHEPKHKHKHKPKNHHVAELISINQTVNRTLRSVIKKEMLLQFKLEDILEIKTKHFWHM